MTSTLPHVNEQPAAGEQPTRKRIRKVSRSAALHDLIRVREADPSEPIVRIQIGEIGGPLLHSSDWEPVAPGNGVDRGIDLQVRLEDDTIGQARLYFERNGARLRAEMRNDVRADTELGRAMAWRAIAMCARSLRLISLDTPQPFIGTLSGREIRKLGADAEQLETNRRNSRPQLHAVDLRRNAMVPTGVRLEPHHGISKARRAVDILVAGGVLLLFGPFALLIAALVRRSSPGPVLFRQLRLGRGGRPFEMLKFRTMDNSVCADVHRTSVENSLRNGTADAKIDDDPRITRVGRSLRAWSLDEVPQFFNVLRGEMTLVGPRPSLLWETSMFTPRTRRRLQMTPGIAGLWQASGRGDLSMEEMLELDLRYTESASVISDGLLIGRTALAVITRKGAR
jgi:lipopolysaccharide/colanic/teichoic acid biosynthesis glycosyltransferase